MIEIEVRNPDEKAIKLDGIIVILVIDDGLSVLAIDMINSKYLALTNVYTINYAVDMLIEKILSGQLAFGIK
jgi:hypothetical protein